MQRRLLLLCLFVGFLNARGDWPAWRGPTRDGHASPGDTVIEKIPAEPKILWRVKIGAGLASPVVAGANLVYFDNVDGKETLHLLEKANHQEKWRASIDAIFHDNQAADGPRNTPMVDGDRVYAVSCRGQLRCLRVSDGREIWSVNYTNQLGATFIGETGNAPGASRHGNNSTPLVAGNYLYACVGGTNGAGVVCFDKMSGEVIWKSQNDPAAYAPPTLARLAGMDQLICFTAEGLIGLNPSTGTLYWRAPIKTAFARHVTSPVWSEDVVVVSSHQVGMIGTRVSRDGNEVAARQAWSSKESAMNFSSPVSKGKYLYGLGPNKNLECVEITSGKQMWSKSGYFQSSADKSYAGFVVIGGNVLCLTDGGQVVLFEANPEKFVEHGTAQVCGLNWCNPAYDDGKLYLRDGNKGPGELICVDLR
jgi:outer membrane protein assembly factor BamB